jgi:hypothetical protein
LASFIVFGATVDLVMASEEATESAAAELHRKSGVSSDDNGTHPTADAEKTEAKPKEPSLLKKLVDSLELDLITILLLMKGGLPPAIALGLLQVDVIANHFTTIGYVVARQYFVRTRLTMSAILLPSFRLSEWRLCLERSSSKR